MAAPAPTAPAHARALYLPSLAFAAPASDAGRSDAESVSAFFRKTSRCMGVNTPLSPPCSTRGRLSRLGQSAPAALAAGWQASRPREARCHERLRFPADAQAQGRGTAACLFRAGAATRRMQTGRTAGSTSMHFVRGDREQGSGESLTARQSAVSQLRTVGRRGNCRVAALG